MKAKKLVFGLLFLGFLFSSGCEKTPASPVYLPKKIRRLIGLLFPDGRRTG